MTGSRCLQCGAQLPVLRKLTGGEFCSDAHRQTYQEELNRMALSRLMQARPREEKPAAAANGRAISRPVPEEPAEPPIPAVAGFITAGLDGRHGSRSLLHIAQPFPFSETLLYPGCPVSQLDGFAAMQAPDPETRTEATPAPPVAERIATTTCLEMYLTAPAMHCALTPADFGAPDIFASLSEAFLCTAPFHVEEEQAAEEVVPAQARAPREITIRALEQAQPEIVQRLEPLPLVTPEPVMPVLSILPLRPAITFTAAPKPVVRREIAVTPPSRSSGPRLVIKATPAPAATPKTTEHIKENLAVSKAPPREEPALVPEVPVPTEVRPDPAQMSTPLTLGLPASEMGSPVFRIWYSTPAKLKVAIVAALLGVVVFSALSKNADRPKVSPTAGLAATAPVAGFTGGSIAMGGGGWVTEWAGDAGGSKRGKQLTLYKPSVPLKDYRTEFVGQIESGSLGWVFRAKDPKNYYAMKIRIVQPGIEPGIVLTRYAVVEGVEGPKVDVPLNLTVRNDTLYKVRVDIQGARFSTYIQGNIVDIWSDDRLNSGGFGFSNERGERAHIRSVSVSF